MEQIRQKAEKIYEKFLNLRDEQAAWLSFCESYDESYFKDFIKALTYVAFRKKGNRPLIKNKRSVGKIFKHCIKRELISKETYLEALTGILESIEDLEIEFPNASRDVADIMVYLFIKEAVPLRDVVDCLVRMNKTSLSANFMNDIFELLMEKKKHEWFDLTWILSKASLKHVVSTNDIYNFFEELLRTFDSHTRAMQQIKGELKQIIVEQILDPNKISGSIVAQIDQMLDVNGDHNLNPENLKTLVKHLLEAESCCESELSEGGIQLRSGSRSSFEDSRESALSSVPEGSRDIPAVIQVPACPIPSSGDKNLNQNTARGNERDKTASAKNGEIIKLTYNSTHALVIKNLIKSGLLKLKHNYADGQWSPINLEGKKQYDSKFIIKLKHDPQSKKKPAIRPYLSIIVKGSKDELSLKDSRGNGDEFLPRFIMK